MTAEPEQVLRQVAATRASAASARTRLADVDTLLGEILPDLEAELRAAIDAPEPFSDAAAHLIEAGGKRVRPLTTLLVTQACGGDVRRAVSLAGAVELIHTAALLHDDVMDEGDMRRGRPAARMLWGNLVSVLAGDVTLTAALDLVRKSGIPEAMDDTIDTMRALVEGEGAQLAARGKDDIGIDGYLAIVRGKTASLFTCACRFGARVANASDDVIDAAGRFGDRVGIAFQVVDDVLDIEGVPHEVGKQLGHDLAEGKTTLPLALALAKESEALRPLLIDARAGDAVAAARVAQAPAVQAACIDARAFAAKETEAGLVELSALPEGRARDLLEGLVRKLTERRA